MLDRGPLGRVLVWLGFGLGGLLAVVGALALRGSGLVAVGVAGAVSAALAAGIVRESAGAGRRAAVNAAWQAAVWTVGALLIVSGVVLVAGGVVATFVTCAGLIAAVVFWLPSFRRRRAPAPGTPGASTTADRPGPPAPVRALADPVRGLAPVAGLPTSALGREWVRTAAALAGRLEPDARASLVRRRQETLDELERRDPDGFARWLAAGADPNSDPARFVRGDQAAGTDAA